MPTPHPPSPEKSRASVAAYEALRRGGASRSLAQRDLRLSSLAAARLEAAFQGRAARGGGDSALPRFARHAQHVAAVMAEGGFPALSERRAGKDCIHLCLPLTRPEQKRA